MRWLLDTCATADEAEQALLTAKQYYACHYIVADRVGRSFIYENSTGRNTQYVLEGNRRPQVVTNFQVDRHPRWTRFSASRCRCEQCVLAVPGAHTAGGITRGAVRSGRCEGGQLMRGRAPGARYVECGSAKSTVEVGSRALWHSLHDQRPGIADFSFYLRDDAGADRTTRERRCEYLRFALDRMVLVESR